MTRATGAQWTERGAGAALAEKSHEVQPAAKQHQANTDLLQRAIRLIADGLRTNALDAEEIATAARDESTVATGAEETGREGRR